MGRGARLRRGYRVKTSGKRIGYAVLVVLVIVGVAAWIDGGEEPLRPIAQPVPLPEAAR